MNKKAFENIMSSLKVRIEECKLHLDNLKNEQDLRKLNVDQLEELKTFCKNELSKMDKIIGTELYHLIGMGRMSAPQLTSFAKQLRLYLGYRPNIKVLKNWLESITTLPKFNQYASYQLNELIDYTLISKNIHYTKTEKDLVETVTEEKNDRPFSIEGNTITVSTTEFTGFFDFLKNICSTIIKDNLEKNMKNGKAYFGIKWDGLENDSYKGSFLDIGIKKQLSQAACA